MRSVIDSELPIFICALHSYDLFPFSLSVYDLILSLVLSPSLFLYLLSFVLVIVGGIAHEVYFLASK